MIKIEGCRGESQTIAQLTMRRSRGGRPTERGQDKRRHWPLAMPLTRHAFHACRFPVGVPRETKLTSITTRRAAPSALCRRASQQ